ncbi:ycf3-interacting protein 1, chloroplastic isoform X2 [Salvia miltiorrhiza]|uniref:ycf3-interacting protein 1, chloroplastic isoform X2 n=1 Tax=Salvia miltiorrhiza TaxID=226208 RepID=UPI0025AC7257|nr:ycf3-interacting protein 1, chloroplastic isoform X2 [Salvia miltiorrhiza]
MIVNTTATMNIVSASGVLQSAPLVVSSLLYHHPRPFPLWTTKIGNGRSISGAAVLVKTNRQDSDSASTSTSASASTAAAQQQQQTDDVDPQDLQYVSQIKTVLELLKKNRDMLFNEVKLTVLIEDPRDVERRRLLGIDDENAPTRDDLADALVQVNEGKIPENRLALQMLAEEMLQWPNLEVEVQKKKKPGKSLYAKFTDTGINPLEAAKRLNMDWDSAAEIDDAEIDDVEVPSAVGYGALYLITAFPVIIGISVVLILFYNSLQ